jgi:hypothetical protein
MTTIVNTPAPTTDNNSSSGFLIAVIGLIVFVVILIYFGLPALKNMSPAEINIPAPQVNVPDKIDVNVKQAP